MQAATELPRRANLDQRIAIAISIDEKQKLFNLAAKNRRTVSEMVRSAIDATILTEQRAA